MTPTKVTKIPNYLLHNDSQSRLPLFNAILVFHMNPDCLLLAACPNHNKQMRQVISLRKLNESTANQILDDEFCRPFLPHNQIFCLHYFNLRSLHFQSWQSLPDWIQLHTSGTSAICTPYQWITNKNTFLCYSLLLGQFQLKLFHCGKGPPKLCIECHPVPLWTFPPKSRCSLSPVPSWRPNTV